MSDTTRHRSESTQDRRTSQHHRRAGRASRNRLRREAHFRTSVSEVDGTRFGVLVTTRLAEKARRVRT